MKGRRHEVKIDKTRRQAPLADTSPKGATEYDVKAETRIAMDAAGLVPRPKYGPVDESKHLVQFYDDATLLAAAVATYIAEALETGASGLVIATKPHVADIEDGLRGRGCVVTRVGLVRPSLEDMFMEAVTDPATGATRSLGAFPVDVKEMRK